MSSLNGTFERKGWMNILNLIPLCERVKQLSAICKICSGNANYTFRHSGDKDEDPSQAIVGGSEMYMPLCRECYNEKTNQAKCKSASTNSGSQSTAFNESNENGEALLEREHKKVVKMEQSPELIKFNDEGEEHLRHII